MYALRQMWIPAYFHDIFLARLLKTTSRLESENSMFSKFVHKKLSLVEFWMRFGCAIKIQWEKEAKYDNANSSLIPQLMINSDLENMEKRFTRTRTFILFKMSCGQYRLCDYKNN